MVLIESKAPCSRISRASASSCCAVFEPSSAAGGSELKSSSAIFSCVMSCRQTSDWSPAPVNAFLNCSKFFCTSATEGCGSAGRG